MSAQTTLAEVDEKLQNARRHATELEAEARDFLESGRIGTISDRDVEDGAVSYVYRKGEDVPVELSAIFGDAIQNARVALDYLVNQLVVLEGRSPKRNAFPICTRSSDWQNRRRETRRRVGNPHVNLIEAAQPYKGGDPKRTPLAMLAKLSNIDKHRALHGAVAFPTDDLPLESMFVGFRPDGSSDRGTVEVLNSYAIGVPFENGARILRVRVLTEHEDTEMHMESDVPVAVAFGEVYGRYVTVEGLTRLIDHADQVVVSQFRPDSP